MLQLLLNNLAMGRTKRSLLGLTLLFGALLAPKKSMASTLSAVTGSLMVFSSLIADDPLSATKGGRLVKKGLHLFGVKINEALPGQNHLQKNREQQPSPKKRRFLPNPMQTIKELTSVG